MSKMIKNNKNCHREKNNRHMKEKKLSRVVEYDVEGV